jgi:hypothetical protein
MSLRTPDAYLGTFRERDTPTLRANVLDNAVPPAAIPGSALITVTMTIYDEHTEEIINSRTQVDIKPNVSEAGALEVELEEEDMVIHTPTRRRERRRILVEWTWDVNKRGSWEGQLTIENVAHVGSP